MRDRGRQDETGIDKQRQKKATAEGDRHWEAQRKTVGLSPLLLYVRNVCWLYCAVWTIGYRYVPAG